MAHSCLSAARTAAALRLPFQADHAASVFPRPARASSSRPHAHRLIAAAPVVPVPRGSRRALAVVALASQEEATAVEEAQEEDVQEEATGQLEEDEPAAGEVEEQQPEEEEEQGAAEEASSDGCGDGSTGTGSSATKLYFGNLPYNCDSALLAGIVQDHAVPEMVEVLYDRTTGRSRGFAFVTMSTLEDCERVIKNLDGTLYSGRTMRVNMADRPKPKAPLYPETEHKLFVGNLSWTVTPEMLTDAFQRCGNVVGARVLYDGETGRSRGYGFVCYSTKEEMDQAIETLNGTEIEGREIRVNLALGKRY
ncbi:28 kDa ribonucleoprotein, chloroplastic-like [Triticum dicoccoides]|uniref:28 kDa ribonucleoprotein, chloroplastic-like n=1 Tax=Triticum dicoccoides TaxID=85692 RepID=UPI0018918B76|nr:28 kDa ribonucleoprotein, chloroplastic-like [Triticum dicoccoides]